MTGGMAFVYDDDASFQSRANPESIVWQRLASAHWEEVLRDLVTAHTEATDSKWSRGLLDEWDRAIGHFWQVVPRGDADSAASTARRRGRGGGGGIG